MGTIISSNNFFSSKKINASSEKKCGSLSHGGHVCLGMKLLLGRSSHGLETACCTGMMVAYLRMKFNLLWYVTLVCLLSE